MELVVLNRRKLKKDIIMVFSTEKGFEHLKRKKEKSK